MSHYAPYFSVSAASLQSCSVWPQPSVTWQVVSLNGSGTLPRTHLAVLHRLRRTNWLPSQKYLPPSSQPLVLASGNEDSIQRIQKIIGRALKEEKKTGFGPPPPNAEAGSGLVNLSGMEDLMAGKREFQVPLPPPPPPAASPLDAVPSEEATEPVPSRQHATVLTPALSPAQTVLAIGLVSVTAVAFGRSSQDLIPDSVITFLQGWMALAWGGHALLGVLAAALAPGKGQPSLPWFFKVLVSGALAFQELTASPKT